MANTTLQIRHSTVQGNTPPSLANGEIAINSRDGILFYATPSGVVTSFSTGPTGLDTEIQFNDAGSVGASEKLTFNKTTGQLTVSGNVRANLFSDDGIDIYDFSNRAFTTANAAFAQANNAATVTPVVFEITSNGTVSTYDIGFNPIIKEAVMVTIAGIVQPVSSYSVDASANTITFSENPQNDELVRVASFYSNASVTYFESLTNITQNNSITAAFLRANNSLDANNGGTISGNTVITKDLTVGGNLSVLGNTFSVNAGSIVSNDSLFILGTGNYVSDVVDIGFAGHYNDGTNAHTGFIRDFANKEWYLFKGYVPEITGNNNIVLDDPSFQVDTLNANLRSNNIILNGSNLNSYIVSSYNHANSGFIQTNAAFNISNSAAIAANTPSHVANSAAIYANGAFAKANAASIRSLNFIIDGGGSVITTGSKGNVMIDFSGTIDGWAILGDASGSITVDVSKSTYATFPTFTASSGTSPSLSSQQKNQRIGINWTGFTTVSANDIIRFAVSGTPATVTTVTVALRITTTS